MNNSVRNTARLIGAGLRALLVLTVVCGVIYPLLVTGIAQAAFSGKANGSEVKQGDKVVGSELYGQTYDLAKKDKAGLPLPDPKWFQPRPSAAGFDDKLGIVISGASNLSADDKDLLKAVRERRAQVAKFNEVTPAKVPVDAVTASASGIDPDISPAYARLQAARVAEANGLDKGLVAKLVSQHTEGRLAGFMGEPRVNVLRLNAALGELK
ncbi:potassium-transporting ATPase subunit KdpC [Streptomyces sp. H27-D2]|uniref:potassium-transporting ATPase subunit KdpC n=1 Tax=Streptomyces sp. H27-D2 TaxID=3046304 RepID=UPI002DBC2E44|nr:potassium-transporting ATPase subunit KdpC [Streptomyces sp. H27-D2]MEC4016620.1 potassium-transporting ATPase subunit KdpC [Streptomyces sp. H27-D2]